MLCLCIFDEEYKYPLPPDSAGEVCISGDSVFSGYIDQPELNSNRFFQFEGNTWFKTGDVGHLDNDGYVFLSGRVDTMMKIDGFKVFPEHVEQTLSKAYGNCRFVAVPNVDGRLAILFQPLQPVDIFALASAVVHASNIGQSFPVPTKLINVPDGESLFTSASNKVNRKVAAELAARLQHSDHCHDIVDIVFACHKSQKTQCDIIKHAVQNVLRIIGKGEDCTITDNTYILDLGLHRYRL